MKSLLLLAFVGESLALKVSTAKLENAVSLPVNISMKELGYDDLLLHVFGPEKGPLVLALHGAHAKRKTGGMFEWESVGKKLEETGHRIIVPNLHTIGLDKEMAPVLSKVLDWAHADSFSVLMGKSWGGKVAAHFAANSPSKVKKLVLAAPSLSEEEVHTFKLDKNIPTLLLWAKDDADVPFSRQEALVASLQANGVPVEVFTAESGGNKVLDAYVTAVEAFAQKE